MDDWHKYLKYKSKYLILKQSEQPIVKKPEPKPKPKPSLNQFDKKNFLKDQSIELLKEESESPQGITEGVTEGVTEGKTERIKPKQPVVKKIDPLTQQLMKGDIILEDGTKKFIDSLKDAPPIYKLKPTDARDVLNKIQSDKSYKSLVDIENCDINMDDKKISITIFRPKGNNNVLHTVIYFHGGGWVLGNKQTHGRLISEIVTRANVAVVFVNYTPAPDKQYPVQLTECFLATKYISENGEKHNVKQNNLILAGDSVGGNMVAAVLFQAKRDLALIPKIGYQILMYPVTDAKMSTESYNKYKDGPWLTKASMEWFFNNYAPDVKTRSVITISPLNASIDQLIDLPPGLIITDENDVLRDEGEAYAHKLMQAHVNIVAVRFLGTVHDFMMLDPLKDTPAVINARKMVIDHIRNFVARITPHNRSVIKK